MKRLILVVMFIFIPGICGAGDSVNVPWEEFKKLYKESIERKIIKGHEPKPFIYSIDSASYKIRLTQKGGTGKLSISGTSISGEPQSIPLFKNNIIIKNIIRVTGGSLLCEQKKNQGILFFPEDNKKFSIEISFFLPAQEDSRSGFVTLDIPKALKNTLRLDLSNELVLLETPGVQNSSGVYNFPSQTSINLRFADKKEKTKIARLESSDLSKHYKSAVTPPIVLDSVSYFTSFEENGNILSVLVVDIPKEAGSYIKINSIPDTDIWSLKVNNESMKVYTSGKENSQWRIPLSKKKNSHVELAMIRQEDKLGLHGRLETFLPGMELAARKVNVAIALPHRIQLISFEGPVSSTSKAIKHPPKEFMGKPYYFSRSFYKGQGMKIAVMYKEPAK